jgi:hypothetical protein
MHAPPCEPHLDKTPRNTRFSDNSYPSFWSVGFSALSLGAPSPENSMVSALVEEHDMAITRTRVRVQGQSACSALGLHQSWLALTLVDGLSIRAVAKS